MGLLESPATLAHLLLLFVVAAVFFGIALFLVIRFSQDERRYLESQLASLSTETQRQGGFVASRIRAAHDALDAHGKKLEQLTQLVKKARKELADLREATAAQTPPATAALRAAAREADGTPTLVSLLPAVPEPETESLAEEFVRECNSRWIPYHDARKWFCERAPRLQVDAVHNSEQTGWGLLRVHRDGDGWLIPAIRRPMGDCSLVEDFELIRYNGVDAIKASAVKQLARQERQGDAWQTVRKGRIDAG
jgi:hypothetical protein